MAEPITIHVVYVCNGEPNIEALASLFKFEPGVAMRYRIMNSREGGFDLGAYRRAAEETDREFVCGLNCHSIIQCDNWLRKMVEPFWGDQGNGVGLVGTTASCESMYSTGLRQGKPLNFIRRWLFPPFPNPHIRTTGFLIRRTHLLEMWPRWFPTKRSCYLFESGAQGLTRQIWHRGLRVLVVGRKGRAVDLDWQTGQEFRRGQQNLLIADNQTCRYERSTAEERKALEQAAWGI